MVPRVLRKYRGGRLRVGLGSLPLGVWNVSGETDADKTGRQAGLTDGIQLSALACEARPVRWASAYSQGTVPFQIAKRVPKQSSCQHLESPGYLKQKYR